VPLEELKRRAEIKFSGQSGAVVASGDGAATTAPSYGLLKDGWAVIEALPPALFDRYAEHRPCGLLCRRGAFGMLLADVLGLPLVPWVLAEPVGKAALKLVDAITGEKKKAKKKAKRNGADAEAAAADVLRRAVALTLPSAEEVKAAWRRVARAARAPAPAPVAEPAPPAPPPVPAPEPEPERAALRMCERAHDRLAMAQTEDGVILVGVAFYIARCVREGCDSYYEQELEMAQVTYKHALRRLMRAYPTEFSGLSERSWWDVVHWTTRMRALGFPIPAAEPARRRRWRCAWSALPPSGSAGMGRSVSARSVEIRDQGGACALTRVLVCETLLIECLRPIGNPSRKLWLA